MGREYNTINKTINSIRGFRLAALQLFTLQLFTSHFAKRAAARFSMRRYSQDPNGGIHQMFLEVQVFCSPFLLLLALYIKLACIGLALSSCSLLDAIVTEHSKASTTGEETKQAIGGSSERVNNYLSSGYLRSALASKSVEKVTGKFLKIVKLDNKYESLAAFEALAISTNGGLYLIHGNGKMVPIPLGEYQLQAAAYCPAMEMVAFAEAGLIHLFELKTGRKIATQNKIKARISSIDFDASCDGVLIGSTDSKVYRWRYRNDQEGSSLREKEQALERYIGHTSVISQVSFHPKGRVFFSADWLGRVLAWVRYDADGFEGEYLTNAVSGRPFTVEGQLAKGSFQADGSVETLRVNQTGELLAVSSDKGQLALLMVRGFRLLNKIQAHNGLIYDLDYSADGKTALTVGRDNRLKVWRVLNLDLDSIDPTEASWELAFETEVLGAYKVVFLDKNRALIGLTNGEVKFISLTPPAPIVGQELLE
jgi:WD40 repeat protein